MKAKASGIRASSKCGCSKSKLGRKRVNKAYWAIPAPRKVPYQKKTRVVGTDVSLKECVKQGYMMGRYDAGKKFTLDTPITLMKFMPEDIRKERRQKKVGKPITYTTTPREIWETYKEYKDEIDDAGGIDVRGSKELTHPKIAVDLADYIQDYNGAFPMDYD